MTNCLLSQSQEIIDIWYAVAADRMVKSGLIAMTDEIWANQHYVEKIMALAQELYADDLSAKAPS